MSESDLENDIIMEKSCQKHYLYALRYKKRWLYIGRTINPRTREAKHRSRKDNHCGSSDIPININWVFVIIDECDGNDVHYLETKYIDFFEPEFNRQRPRIQNIPISYPAVRKVMTSSINEVAAPDSYPRHH